MRLDYQHLCTSSWTSLDAGESKRRGVSQGALSSQEAWGSTDNQFCLWICDRQKCAAQDPLQGRSHCPAARSVVSRQLPAVSSFRGASAAERCLAQGHAFPWDGPRPTTEHWRSVKGQPFLPNLRLSMGNPCPEHPTRLA